MIYAFPYTDGLFDELLSSYKGDFNEMYIPKSKSANHTGCYVSLAPEQKIAFFKHFSINESNALLRLEDYPGMKRSRLNKKANEYVLLVNRKFK